MKADDDIKLIVVKDANIIFDFWDLDIMETFLKINYDIYVTGLVHNEIRDDKQKVIFREYTDASLIKIDNANLDDILDVFNSTSGISIEDSSIIEFGQRKKATILTNDNKLGKVAKKRKLKCHGLLWCIKIMIEQKLISLNKGIELIKKWMVINERAPKKICIEYIEKLKMKFKK
jgi:predicted nucleic acid-binding protein